MTRYLHRHDPDVDNAEWAEIVDADRDERPTRAECEDVDEWPAPKVAHEPCEDCDHTLCQIQRTVQRWVA